MGHPLLCRRRLLLEFGFEGLLAFGDVGLVSRGIDEGVLISTFEAIVFLVQAEIAAVGAQEDVAGELLRTSN